jgi:UDP-glucose 4-epimerase
MVAEHYLRYYAAQGALQFTALRYGNVYGPRQDPSGEAGVIAIFCGRAVRGEPLRIDWDGEQTKDYVFVGDVAAANLSALERATNETLNVGTGIGTSVNSLHLAIAAAAGHNLGVVRAPKRPGDVRECVFAIEKAKALLGWQPETPLHAGIRKTLEFFEAPTAAR